MKNLVVFDFDWTLCDGDSDYHAISLLSPELKQFYLNILDTKEGYLAANDLFLKVHSCGFYKEQLLNNLQTLPIHPSTVEIIKKSKLSGNDVVIISDQNDLFINQVLSNYGIIDCIDLVLTNKVIESENRLLRLIPFKHPVDEAHGCDNILVGGKKMCNMNLCKGKELKELMSKNQYSKVIYTGDGKNDFCPMLQLRSQDVMCIRKGHSLEQLHQLENPNFDILSNVKFWADGADLFKIFEYFNIFQIHQ